MLVLEVALGVVIGGLVLKFPRQTAAGLAVAGVFIVVFLMGAVAGVWAGLPAALAKEGWEMWLVVGALDV